MDALACNNILPFQFQMTAKNLDQNTFPLYAIHAINHNYFVCAGGGGAAKTGVNNAIVSDCFFLSNHDKFCIYIFKEFQEVNGFYS